MAWFAGPVISSILSTLGNILPYLLVAGLVVGVYFYGHHVGTTECNAAQLQNIIDIQKKQITDLQNQEHDLELTVATLNGKIAADDKALADAQKKLPFVIVSGPKCNQTQAFIDLFNGVRK